MPDWGRFAESWDAVHLTLGGLLMTDQVRITGSRGWTELQGWNAEQAAWVRWSFDEVYRLPNLTEPPPSPIPLEFSVRLDFPGRDPEKLMHTPLYNR